jgi:hypothetical protein
MGREGCYEEAVVFCFKVLYGISLENLRKATEKFKTFGLPAVIGTGSSRIRG